MGLTDYNDESSQQNQSNGSQTQKQYLLLSLWLGKWSLVQQVLGYNLVIYVVAHILLVHLLVYL